MNPQGNKEKYYWKSGTDKNKMLFVVHRENSALWFIVFFAEYVYVAYFDSSSWHCLVDRACGDTKCAAPLSENSIGM